ncbi:MAG: hypothetical protein IH571_06685, partial [Acholeplasmataceae bacterium]|nr:hypothetical protein [Acholeplasmataceae bacterium]
MRSFIRKKSILIVIFLFPFFAAFLVIQYFSLQTITESRDQSIALEFAKLNEEIHTHFSEIEVTITNIARFIETQPDTSGLLPYITSIRSSSDHITSLYFVMPDNIMI